MVSDDEVKLAHGATSIRANFTSYAAIERIMVKLGRLVVRRNTPSEGPVHALIGMTRSGKSQLLKKLLKDHAIDPFTVTRPNGDFAVQMPVVYLKFVGNSQKDLTEAVYFAITGRTAASVLGSRCKQDAILKEIFRLREECGIRLLILDEAHQSILNKTDHAAKEVSKLAKDLSNGFFSVLLVGTEELRRLIHADEELEGRSPVILPIHPFKRQRDDMEIWTEILDDIDDVLKEKVFGKRSGLSKPPLSEALMTASGGTVGHMATLVENGAIEAIDQWVLRRKTQPDSSDTGPDCLGWDHLEIAFSEWAPGHARPNPFHPDARPSAGKTKIPEKATVAIDPVPEIVPVDPGRSSNARGTTARAAKDNIFRT